MPATEQRDLRMLLRHRHQWVGMRTRVQNTLHAMGLSNGLRRGHGQAGQQALEALPLAPFATGIASESLTGIKSESVTTFIAISGDV